MPHIFISYRRDDSAATSGRIYDYLEKEFGEGSVFKDVDSIQEGHDFRVVVKNAIQNSAVVLVVIGKIWLTIPDSSGQRRLDDPEDLVRHEVAQALQQQNTLVIPVLVDGARMPGSDDLPDGIRELAFANAANVRNDPDFRRDMARLVNTLKQIDEREAVTREREKQAAQQATRRTIGFAALIGVLVLVAFVTLFATGTLQFLGIGATLDPIREAFRLLTNTAVADAASRATPTQDLTQTIQFILDSFAAETATAEQSALLATTQLAETDNAMLSAVPTETPTPSITPSATPSPDRTLTAAVRETSLAGTQGAQATNDYLATQQAPTNTALPTDSPSPLPTATLTHSATFTATFTPSLTRTPSRTFTPTPNAATRTVVSVAQVTAAIQAARATLTQQSADLTGTADRWTPTPSRTPRPTSTRTRTPRPTATRTPRPTSTRTPRPTSTPIPRLGILFETDFSTLSGIRNASDGWHLVTQGGNSMYCIDNTTPNAYPGFEFGTTLENVSVEAAVRIAPARGNNPALALLTRSDEQRWGYRHSIYSLGVAVYYYGMPNDTVDYIGEATTQVNFDTWYVLRAEVEGDEVRTYFEGELVSLTTDDRAEIGGVSLEVFPDTSACVDNLVVRSLDHSANALRAAQTGLVIADGTSIRRGPSRQEASLTTLDDNDRVYILDSASVVDWLLVYDDASNIQGWVYRDLIDY